MKQLCPFELEPYVLFNEDCVLTSKRFVDSSIDLVYVDPPFCSGRSYELNGCSFDDKWRTTEEYIDWIKPRLVEFKRILKPTGSIYIHCDWHISHYIKVLADSIFGQRNFLNEIVWKRQSAHNDARQGSKHFGRIHDVVLVYTASQKYVWNQEYLPYDHDYLKQAYKHVELKTGRRYALGDLTGPGGASKGNPLYYFLGVKRYWRYSRTKMMELFHEGRIFYRKGRVPLKKRYLDEMPGIALQDIWTDLKSDFRKTNRFPTQKPESLLERIIKISTNPDQIVYEPFAGSATAGVVSKRLSRRWIGSETSKRTCQFAIDRLRKINCNAKLLTSEKLEFEASPKSLTCILERN